MEDEVKNNNNKRKSLNLKTIIIYGCITMLLTTLISILPIFIYYNTFKDYTISDTAVDWAALGDYIGGTTGTLFSFFALGFSLISVIVTVGISLKIQEDEFRFREEQAIRDKKLLFYQNKPCPYIDLHSYPDKIRVVIQNAGIGPLLITDWKLKDIVEYNNFRDLLNQKLPPKEYLKVKIDHNSAPTHNVAPNGEKEIFSAKIENEKDIEGIRELQVFRDILGKTKLTFMYKDVFDNEFDFEKDLSFFLRAFYDNIDR